MPTPTGDSELHCNGKLLYDNVLSKIAIGGFDEVYPTPGFVIATLTIFPPTTEAVPINSILGMPVLEVAIPTFIVFCIPDL